MDPTDRRCGSCARFVRVVEVVDATGEVTRRGECLLGVWPAPLYETSTCSQWVRKGEFRARPPERERVSRPTRTRASTADDKVPFTLTLPEDLLDMDANEFRRVLRFVIRDELGVSADVQLAGKWEGGEIVLKPGKEGMQEKRIPI